MKGHRARFSVSGCIYAQGYYYQSNIRRPVSGRRAGHGLCFCESNRKSTSPPSHHHHHALCRQGQLCGTVSAKAHTALFFLCKIKQKSTPAPIERKDCTTLHTKLTEKQTTTYVYAKNGANIRAHFWSNVYSLMCVF